MRHVDVMHVTDQFIAIVWQSIWSWLGSEKTGFFHRKLSMLASYSSDVTAAACTHGNLYLNSSASTRCVVRPGRSKEYCTVTKIHVSLLM